MYTNIFLPLGNGTQGLSEIPTITIVVFLFILLWSLFWKGWSLWLAARRKEKTWFVILLLVNTFGILELIYVLGIAKRKDTK